MIIQRDRSTGLLPRAYYVLLAIHEYELPSYHAQYKKRHPLGIYNVSLGRLWTTLGAVLTELDTILAQSLFEGDYGEDHAEPLLVAQMNLISAINSHFDDCETVMRCLHSESISIEGLRKDPRISSDWDEVFDVYRKPVSKIANHVKHHQGRYRFLAMQRLNQETSTIPGYFIEGVNSDGEVGPFEEIHKPYHHISTAFSFFRDLRLRLWGIFYVSEKLALILERLTGVSAPTITEAVHENLVDLVRSIASMPMHFFLDEHYAPVPSVRLDDAERTIGFRLAYPDVEIQLPDYSGIYQIRTQYRGDGISKTFKLPYAQSSGG